MGFFHSEMTLALAFHLWCVIYITTAASLDGTHGLNHGSSLSPISTFKMPRFSWNTLPVSFHSSNETAPNGMYSPESLKILAKYPLVTIEKYQGEERFFPNPNVRLPNCQNGTNVTLCGCCVEDNIVAVGRAIKDIEPTTMVLGYLNTQIGYPIYRSGQVLASHPEWWSKDSNGDVIYWSGHSSMVYWDHSNKMASNTWMEGCLNMTRTGYIDGCDMDGCIKVNDGESTNPIYKKAYMKNKNATMVDLQIKVNGPLICGSNGDILPGVAGSAIQNWGKKKSWSTREIPMIMRAVAAGVLFEAHGECPSDASDPHTINNIAAFLIGAGRWSYYRCGKWSGYDPTWYPIYDFPLGEPLSNATLGKDGVWRRNFKFGTNVTFDTKNEVGTIKWGKKHA